MKSLNERLKSEFKHGKILLISIGSEKYRETQRGIVDFLAKTQEKVCYVTLNDPFDCIASNLGNREISGLFFIDCVSSTVKSPKAERNVAFVSSPRALTEISIAIKSALAKGSDFIVFDSISAMLVYEEPLSILKFIHSIVLALRQTKSEAAFIILMEDAASGIFKDLKMFVDGVIEVI